MTAKPQPMAGQSDASDDLIAELAKLMAQDAQGDKPAPQASAAFPVRIPGGDSAPPPAPRFNFAQSSAASQSPAAAPARAAEPVSAPAVAAPSSPAPAAQAPASQPAAVAPKPAPASDPFHFDFDLSVAPSAQPAPSPRVEAAPAPVAGPSSPIRPPADPTFMPVDHDSIADLIAAELEGNPEPVSAEPPVTQPQPQPVPAQPATAPQPARPAPQSTAAWSPVSVPPSLDSQAQPARPAMRPLNLQPAARPEQDKFKVAPVFGLPSGRAEPSVAPVAAEPAPAPEPSVILPGGAPTRSEPSFDWSPSAPATPPRPETSLGDDSIGRDPIDEIESLIGNAMRVELDRGVTPDRAAEPLAQPERAAPSPALRSLATPTVPQNRNLSGADEAILAAAEATGVQIGWVDAPDTFEATDPVAAAPRRQRSAQLPRMTRALAGPLVAVTLLLAAGFGLYWVLGLGRETGPAPLLTADTTPIKETPVVAPDAETPQQSVVFNEIDGVVPGAEEQLVSRDQADVNEVTQIPPTADASEEGLANRKVRTVTVRPDGTIVSGDDSVAGSNILPVARPNVPEVPGAEAASPELVAAATPTTGTPAASTTPQTTTTPAIETPEPAATPAPAAVAPVTPGATVPAVDASGAPLAGKTTVIPLQRPAGLVGPSAAEVAASAPVTAIVDSGVATGNMLPPPPRNNALTGTTTNTAPATPAPQAAAPAAQASAAIPGATEVEALGNTAPAYVQLASQRSEAEARSTAQGMVSRYGPLFGGANLEVQRVDLGERGIYYRVRVPAQSRDSANSICTNVKAAGGDCVVM